MSDPPCFTLPPELWDYTLQYDVVQYGDLLRLSETCSYFRSVVQSSALDRTRRRLGVSSVAEPVTSATAVKPHPFLLSQDFHLQLPYIERTLARYASTSPNLSVLHERVTFPPVRELWIVVLSHSLHVESATGEGVTIAEALERLRAFWNEDVTLKWEGYSALRRRVMRGRHQAEKDRIKQEMRSGFVKSDALPPKEREEFTWWESLEKDRRDPARCDARWERAQVDSMGNVRLVVERFQT